MKQVSEYGNEDSETISDNYNDEMMTNNNQVIVDKVIEVNTSVMLSDNSDAVENEVSMCDTLSNISDDERGRLVGVSNEVLVSVDELEKEWKESLQVEGLQLSLIHI